MDPVLKDQTEAHIYCRLQYKDDAGNELISQELRISGQALDRFFQAFSSLREGFLRFLASERHLQLEEE
jgi:hypothetical protein